MPRYFHYLDFHHLYCLDFRFVVNGLLVLNWKSIMAYSLHIECILSVLSSTNIVCNDTLLRQCLTHTNGSALEDDQTFCLHILLKQGMFTIIFRPRQRMIPIFFKVKPDKKLLTRKIDTFYVDKISSQDTLTFYLGQILKTTQKWKFVVGKRAEKSGQLRIDKRGVFQ